MNTGFNQDQGMKTELFETPTYYRILSIDPSATRLMVRESYLRLKNLFQGGAEALYGISDAGDSERQASELEEAFSVLNDDTRRAEYDRSIGIVNQRPGALSMGASSVPFQASQPVSQVMPQDHWTSPQSDTIQTNRSILRVIRTRANRSSDVDVQALLATLLSEADLGDGTILLKLRQAVGVSDLEIQERTKICIEYIRAMESNRFDRLPQVVFVRGFMRSYLKYLCVPNPEAIISAFAARLSAWQQGNKQ